MGTLTPEAAAQTLLSALKSGNSNRVGEVLTWKITGDSDPALDEIKQTHVRQMGTFAAELKEFRIQPEDTDGKDKLTIMFEGEGASGHRMNMNIPVAKVGSEWRILGEIENFGRSENGLQVRVSVPFMPPRGFGQ